MPSHAFAMVPPSSSRHFRATSSLVTYAPNVTGASEEAFRELLDARRSDELLRRTSLVGPHRDGLPSPCAISEPVRSVRTVRRGAAALCLRLGLAAAVAAETGEPPLLLVDDPFSALDPDRRDRTRSGGGSRGGQVVISGPDEADVPPASSAVWDVAGGAVAARG